MRSTNRVIGVSKGVVLFCLLAIPAGLLAGGCGDDSGTVESNAVLIRADWISAGVQSGCSAVSKAPAPATWGLDMEVPWMMLYSTPSR